jgi:uncharacterized membrane protein YoaK (UPF0700 family)
MQSHTEMAKTIIDSPSLGQGMIFIAALAMIVAGVVSIRTLKVESPLAPYALQILGLLFITPVLLLLSATTNVSSDVITGLLGTIVGYIFGTARVQQGRLDAHSTLGNEVS